MSGICGWLGAVRDGEPGPLIGSMSEALTRFDGSTLHTAWKDFGAIAASGFRSTMHVHADDTRLVALQGHVRLANPKLAVLARECGFARALAYGHSHLGADLLATLSGSFVLAILNGAADEGLLAVDRIGIHPLFYREAGEALVFGSSLDSLGIFPAAKQTISRQAIYDYLHFHMVPGPQTIYADCKRLLPGQFLLWKRGSAQCRSYWNMRFVENDRRPLPELKHVFVGLVRDSVREACGDGAAGAFLSGGTDSSTIAGMLGEVTGEPARTYSIGFREPGYDEMDYARLAARHFKTQHHEYYVTPEDVAVAIPKIAAVHDQPFGNSSAIPTYYCAKLAREDGIELLLGGDGGDELFGGNARYATQYLLSLYADLPAALRKRFIEPVAFGFPEIGLIGKAQRYIRYASLPMPRRYDYYNLLERLGPGAVLTPEFLTSVDGALPLRQMTETYDNGQAHSLINRMLAFDVKYTLADNDLPKVQRSCDLAKINVRFPLLDDSLVDFSLRLPPGLKLKGTQLRFFFKEALRGFLPEAIILKSKHGFGLPFGPWLQREARLQQLVMDSLARLRKWRVVRPEFLDELMSTHLREHAEYYGTMAWLLVMLEQWLENRKMSV